jgi:hypothetical protein
MEVKYKHTDFMKILDAFINIQEKGSPDKLTSDDLKPFLDYPEPVLNEFLRATEALPEETVEKMSTDGATRGAVEIYILMRMNFVEIPRPKK